MSKLERAWQNNSLWLWLLAPFTWVFFCLSALRRRLYASGLLRSCKVSVPVVIVGNISVGGNGKTPVVLALAEHLHTQGLTVGILSRGYGGQCTTFPHVVNRTCEAAWVGDEPALLAQRTAATVVIDPNRVRGAQRLAQHCDVIICDDGLQHYALQRDIEIVVMDERGVGNGCLLPMGPLREGKWRLHTVDYVIHNGAKPEKEHIHLQLVPEALRSVRTGEVCNDCPRAFDRAIAAIGNPQRFFSALQQQGIALTQTEAFADHHRYSAADLRSDETIIMTEKDAVKCRAFASESWYYLPVKAQFSDDFLSQITERVQEMRNGKI